MEQKKVLRKLTLNKEEIVSLNSSEMESLKGGTNLAILRWVGQSIVEAAAVSALSDALQGATCWVGCTTAPIDNTTYYGGQLNEVIIKAG